MSRTPRRQLFALAARVAGPASTEVEHLARHAGLAQGFMGVIAALPRDASRRQLFLPLQLLESHGGAAEEVFSGTQTPRTRAALDQLIGEARDHLDTALSLLADVAPRQRPVFLPLSLLRRDLDRMSRAGRRSVRAQRCDRGFRSCGRYGGPSRSRPFKAG